MMKFKATICHLTKPDINRKVYTPEALLGAFKDLRTVGPCKIGTIPIYSVYDPESGEYSNEVGLAIIREVSKTGDTLRVTFDLTPEGEAFLQKQKKTYIIPYGEVEESTYDGKTTTITKYRFKYFYLSDTKTVKGGTNCLVRLNENPPKKNKKRKKSRKDRAKNQVKNMAERV